jgi:conserved oligomeric Golgi complex subunit 6
MSDFRDEEYTRYYNLGTVKLSQCGELTAFEPLMSGLTSSRLSPPLPSSVLGERKRHLWTPQIRNPISSRVYKVLGTNFNDDATREALCTLSELYVSTSTSGKEHDLKSEIEDLTDENAAEEGDAIHRKPPFKQSVHLSEAIPGEFASRARKQLHRDMEKKLAEGSRQLLKALGDVDQVRLFPLLSTTSDHIVYPQKLAELQKHIITMRHSCEDAETQLRITNEASKSLLERAETLRLERYVQFYPRILDMLSIVDRK